MNEKTKHDYIKLAKHFLQGRLMDNGIPVTPRNIKNALIGCAADYRPAYWRRLRCALVTHQREAGYIKSADYLKAVSNPVTASDAPLELKAQKKAKQQRRKHVTKEEHELLTRYLKEKGDRSLLAAIDIVRLLGCRPVEMMTIDSANYTHVSITGAKKREDGLRGLDRTVVLTEKEREIVYGGFLMLVEYSSLKRLSVEQVQKRLQHRLANATKKLWPRRKHQITLYSYRHQMGSDLKASGMDRKEIAAIMGHQSVDSVDVYGNKRRSRRQLSIHATEDSIANVRKTTLKNPDFIAKKKSANDATINRVPQSRMVRF